MKQKQSSRLIFKILNFPEIYLHFSNLQIKICKHIRYRDYKLYINNTNNTKKSVKVNLKYFWKFYN